MKITTYLSLIAIVVSASIFAQTGKSQTTNSSLEKDVLLKLTDEITYAKSRRDPSLLARVLTDDIILTNPAGYVANKTEFLEGTKADTATYEAVTNSELVVNNYGDAAVVTGKTKVKGRHEGREIGGEFRFTNVYVRQKNEWKCAAIQLTRIAQI